MESKYAASRLAEIGPQLVSAHAEMDLDASRLLTKIGINGSPSGLRRQTD
ncbi:MAG: hypothetical protein R3C28_31825 [Pirellulaceae bacterium]